MKTTCVFPECSLPAKGRGLCQKHWQSEKANGRLYLYVVSEKGKITNCPHVDRKHSAKGMCASCYTTAWMKANPDKDSGNKWLKNHPQEAKHHLRKNHLKATYGLSIEQYEAMWIKQDGKCANPHCTYKATDMHHVFPNGLDVDHDHITGKIRGLLCRHCNQALSRVIDSQHVLTGLIQYLEEYK